MILHFTFFSRAGHIAFFVNFWAKRSGMKYALRQNDESCELFIEGDEAELGKFSDDLAKMSTSVFLKDTSVELCEQMPEAAEFKSDFTSNNITPFALENDKNECGFGSDENFIEYAKNELLAGKSVKYNGLEISVLNDFNCDYIMPTRLNLLAKIFICDEKSMIALSSFEKPVIRLRTSALFRSNHDASPLFFGVRAAFDINLFKLCNCLEGINFLAIKDSNIPFSANLLERQLCVSSGGEFAPVLSSTNKLASLFALVLNEYKMPSDDCALFYFSKENDDFIKVFKPGGEYNLLKIILPKSYEEIYEKIAQKGALIDNFKAKFALPSGEIKQKTSSFYSLFCIIAKILDFKDDILDLANDFNGEKGVRIDFKMQSKDEFDAIALINSAMSFKLAGAEPRNIAFGLVESLAYFIEHYTELINKELECANFVLLGSLFDCKSLSEISLRQTKAKISEIYPLELP